MTESNLVQTKGFYSITGIITGKDTPKKGYGYKTGEIQKGDSKGKKYNSIRFPLKTSNNNIVDVELFGTENTHVTFYNKVEKKQMKIEWDKRNVTPPANYELRTPAFDMVESINKEFKDGDVVNAWGSITFSTYTNSQGETVEQYKLNIGSLTKYEKELNFDDEEYKEINSFTQEIVINEVIDNSSENCLDVYAFVVNYNKTTNPASFQINKNNVVEEFYKKFKTLKFGDFIKVNGSVLNQSVVSIDPMWGEQVSRSFKRCLEIRGADGSSYESKKYKVADFAKPEVETVDWNDIKELPF